MSARHGIVSSMAGCYTCHGSDAKWFGLNGIMLAARHYRSTGHPTWCERVMSSRYGAPPK